jgi:hypothetical protein
MEAEQKVVLEACQKVRKRRAAYRTGTTALRSRQRRRSKRAGAVVSKLGVFVRAERLRDALTLGQLARLVLSRRWSVWIDANGQIQARTEARPGEPNMPLMRVRGRFLLGG